MVYEAIAKYMTEKPQSTEGSLTVTVGSTARSTQFIGSFTKNEKSLQRSDKVSTQEGERIIKNVYISNVHNVFLLKFLFIHLVNTLSW